MSSRASSSSSSSPQPEEIETGNASSSSSTREQQKANQRPSRKSQQQSRRLITSNTLKGKPRFLGDGESDEEDGGSGGAHNRFFNEDDLNEISNKRGAYGIGNSKGNTSGRRDNDLFDGQAGRRLGGGEISDDEDSLLTLGGGGGELGEAGIEGGEDDLTIIKKKRIVAKMNDERLLGNNGFVQLQKEIMKFKPKGKGSESKDLQRLMSIYQLWCHQMYPKTNLRDTLQSVEKLCHKRSVHRALKGYREEARNFGKPPSETIIIPDDDEDIEAAEAEENLRKLQNANTSKEKSRSRSISRSISPPLVRREILNVPTTKKLITPSGTAKSDLETLFDDDDDEEEAMREIEAMESSSISVSRKGKEVDRHHQQEEEEEDFEALLALMHEDDLEGLNPSSRGVQKSTFVNDVVSKSVAKVVVVEEEGENEGEDGFDDDADAEEFLREMDSQML